MALRLNGSTGFVALEAPTSAGSNTITLPTSNGSANQYLKNGSTAGELEWGDVSSLSNAEDGSGTDFEFNSGYGSNATAYGVRAWATWRGDTVSGGNNQLDGSGNVDDITDGGTGTYTINFTNNMPDTNYVVVGNLMEDLTGGRGDHIFTIHRTARAVGSVKVNSINLAGTLIADDYVWAAIIR